MKTCSRCSQSKPLEEFYKKTIRRGEYVWTGTHAECKKCLSARVAKQDRRDYEAVRGPARRVTEQYRQYQRAYQSGRRSLVKQVTVGTPNYDDIYDRDGGICYLCGLPSPVEVTHFDHVVPLSRGGLHSDDNIRVTHSTCNLQKGARFVAA